MGMNGKKIRTRSYRIPTALFHFQSTIVSELNATFHKNLPFSDWVRILWLIFFDDEEHKKTVFGWVSGKLNKNSS